MPMHKQKKIEQCKVDQVNNMHREHDSMIILEIK